MKKPQRILVIRTDRIGDTVLATPLIRALRETFPRAFIGAMVRPYTQDVLRGNPHLDAIILDDPKGENRGVKGFSSQIRTLRSFRFDTALLLMPTARLAWMLLLAGIPRRIGVGAKPYEILTLMQRVSRNKYIPLRHEADYCMDLGRLIGVTSENLKTEVFLSDEERNLAWEKLVSSGIPRRGDHKVKFIGIHPGSGRSSPNWKVKNYAELASLILQSSDGFIIITGSPDESFYGDLFREIGDRRIINLIGRLSLRELMGIIGCYDMFISASTGPMHLAAALGVPTISMFCPLPGCSPKLWGPMGSKGEIILPEEKYCQHNCPGDPHTCTFERGITPEKVAKAALDFLEQKDYVSGSK